MNKHINESRLVEIFARGLSKGSASPEPMFCVEAKSEGRA
jgi:hypothetical protein